VRAARRHVAALGPDPSVAGQSLVALGLNSATSLVAGAVLGSITGTFERYPGLLVLVPAAIGLRGNVFSALGSRLSSAIHQGLFRPSLRPGTVTGDNLAAALLLTTGLSLALAVVAKLVALAVGVRHTVPLVELATISIVGGLLASLVVVVATVALAVGSVRFGWDLDNLIAPVVSTLGDVLTLPALWVATLLVGHGAASDGLGWVLVAGAVAATGYGVTGGWGGGGAGGRGGRGGRRRRRRTRLRAIVRESWPVLVAAGLLSTLAGVVLEKRLGTFDDLPALLVLVPAFVSTGGALGGILASRLSTGLHLGTVRASAVPGRLARRDIALVATLAGPVYVLNAAGAHVTAGLLGTSAPGLGSLLAVTLIAGTATLALVVAVAYGSSIAAYRAGLDPDSYGIPVVTSATDFLGTLALITTALALHLA
jgi:mgtE-like transporter